MIRLLLIFAVLGGIPSVYGQERAPDPVEEFERELLRKDYEKYPPLRDVVELRMDEAKVEVLYNTKTEKAGGISIECRVMLKNLKEKPFSFVPGDVNIEPLDAEGVAIPEKYYRWNSFGHGDSGTYPIEHGERLGKNIRLLIVDDNITAGSVYNVIGSYLHIYDDAKPIRCTVLSGLVRVTVTEEDMKNMKNDEPEKEGEGNQEE